MASPTRQAAALALKESLADVVAGQGADLEDVEISAAGRRTRIRVVVDADEGIDLDAIATISQAVSAVLDDRDSSLATADVIGSGPYTLEVTSPGVDRPLTMPRHWRRNVSRLVEVTLNDSQAVASESADADTSDARRRNDRLVVGRIMAANDTTVTIDVDGQAQDIPLAAIAHAIVRIEFRRPDEGR